MNDSKYTIHVQRVNYRMKVSHVYRINYHIYINVIIIIISLFVLKVSQYVKVIYFHGVNKNGKRYRTYAVQKLLDSKKTINRSKWSYVYFSNYYD